MIDMMCRTGDTNQVTCDAERLSTRKGVIKRVHALIDESCDAKAAHERRETAQAEAVYKVTDEKELTCEPKKLKERLFVGLAA